MTSYIYEKQFEECEEQKLAKKIKSYEKTLGLLDLQNYIEEIIEDTQDASYADIKQRMIDLGIWRMSYDI